MSARDIPLERQLDAEAAAHRLATIMRIDRYFARHPERRAGGWATSFALAHQRQRLIEAQRQQERIERGEECERCGSQDIERTSVITPLFTCKACGHTVFDLTTP